MEVAIEMENYQNNSKISLIFVTIKNKRIPCGYYFVDENAPLIIDFHGGNFQYGDMFVDHKLCEQISIKCNCNVISISNGDLEGSQFPEAINQSITMIEEIYNDKKLEYDRERIYLMGQESGGNFALTCMLNNTQIHFSGLILNYPFLNMIKRKRKHKRFSPFNFTRNNYLKKYFKNESDRSSVLANPLLENDKKYSLLPKVIIVVGSYDNLIEDAVELAAKLSNNNVQNKIYEIQGAIPEFLDFVSSNTCLTSPTLSKKRKAKQIDYFNKTIEIIKDFIH